ncbi:MAG: DUF3084 domain-containing protein [bacterium]|nr:DUF3084 domain-containing protein [bacterium]
MWVDIIRGSGTILIIMIVAGAIAYVGDRVGHQVGRKRMTLFGIRPRYTSTIVAVGTGMLIAFSVTLTAILASQQVKTAFFKLNALNAQIQELQSREHELESKVNTGQLVVRVDSLMVPFYGSIPRNQAVDKRLKNVKTFYSDAVDYMNSTYTRLGLKKFVPPGDIDKTLRENFGTPEVTVASMESNLLLVVTADQNLYRNDPIHFQLNVIGDVRRFQKGGVIASLVIPAGASANVNLAVNELQNIVANIAASDWKLPAFLANNVQVVQVYPDAQQMASQLAKGSGKYVMTAFAEKDIYPHSGGVPIVVTLTQAK